MISCVADNGHTSWRSRISVAPTLQDLIRFLLFRFEPETSHRLVLGLLRRASEHRVLLRLLQPPAAITKAPLAVRIMGLTFPNPLGLAAGFDKNATAIPAFAAMGFGYLELGTVTPRPQHGNPKPRLFRLNEDRAIVNRMGFNSVGLDRFLANLRNAPGSVPLGINIGKNADTPLAQAEADYLHGLSRVYASADYVTVNVSSPNTPALRELQEGRRLHDLLQALKQRQSELSRQHGRYVPLALKIAPDLSEPELDQITDNVLRHRVDAVIATNTTLQRPASLRSRHASQTGGLSGRPLKSLSTDTVARLANRLGGEVPIIGVGGIEDDDDAWDKLMAGAVLLQIYTGIIFQGPALVGKVLKGIQRRMEKMQLSDLADAIRHARQTSDYGNRG